MSLISEIDNLIKSDSRVNYNVVNSDLIIFIITDIEDFDKRELDFLTINNHIKRLVPYYVNPFYNLNDFKVLNEENCNILYNSFKYVLVFKNSRMAYCSLKNK